MTSRGDAVADAAAPARWPVVELRQYTLHPGRRDELVELFDREFVEHAFVWLTRFPGADAHEAFVGSPAWREAALPALAGWLRAAPQQLRLSPTPRSALR